MSQTGVISWSQTAASNASADANQNWAEGMAPSQINDSARAGMASVAKWRDDKNGTLVTSGSSTAFTVATNQIQAALTNGYEVAVRFHATTSENATLAVDGLAAEPIVLNTATTGLNGGEYVAGQIVGLTYSSTATAWVARDFVQPKALGLATLTTTDQTISGGANVTTYQGGTQSGAGTYTIDCGTCPLQFITNGGNFTLAAPSKDGSCMILMQNNSSAGTVSFSGFTVGSNTGDALDTTNLHLFTISVWRIQNVSSYFVKALQ